MQRTTPATQVPPSDGLILQRYVAIDGEIKRFMAVAKMRGLDHDERMRLYDIGPDGIVVGEPLTGYDVLLIDAPRRIAGREAPLSRSS